MNNAGLTKYIFWFVAGAAVAVALVTVLAQRRSTDENQPLIVRSYEVKPEIAQEMRVALESAIALGRNNHPVGHVTLSPNGRLLVTAPESVQRGVASILEEVAHQELTPTPSINFEVWLVSAQSGVPNADAAVAEVEPALTEIAKIKGATRFDIWEKLSTRVRAGQRSKISGMHASMMVVPSMRRSGTAEPMIAAEVEIVSNPRRSPSAGDARIGTQVELRPGELLVLGQSGFEIDTNNPQSAAPQQLYYILRASL